MKTGIFRKVRQLVKDRKSFRAPHLDYTKANTSWKAGRTAVMGLGISSSVFLTDYSQHGTGAALAHGVASSTPILWMGVMAAEGLQAAGEYGYKHYHDRRRMNMGRPMLDSYGTLNAMRMDSLQKMQRGHNRIRTIGNEARLLHR